MPLSRPRTSRLRSSTVSIYVFLASLIIIVISTAFLGLSASRANRNPVRGEGSRCDNSDDPVFWQGLAQMLLRISLVAGLSVLAIRERYNNIQSRIRYVGFFVLVAASVINGVLGMTAYAIFCTNGGWLTSLILGWMSDFTATCAALELARALLDFQ
ncbi:hypothetical protein MGN70_001765 [Eutypa lata]|nr:hypothetical protein MGN70_001765 [Eutypa lata]